MEATGEMSQLTKYAIAVIITAAISIGATYGVLTYTQVGLTEGKGKELKAGFIYVGPVQDYGWSYAHDRGRKIIDQKYDWLTTISAESIAPADVGGQIDSMFEKGADIVFTTSFPFMEKTVQKGEEWPDKMLYHCSGGALPYKELTGKKFKADNVGFYFADFYQIYYMNGLMAGALTDTDKIGYIAAHTTSEVVRHLDSFMLGAKEVNPNVTMKVIETGSWYAPADAREAVKTLEQWGADAIAYTQDSTAVVKKCQEIYNNTGKRIYTFSHYTPMESKGQDVVISGQLVHWENLYNDLLLKARSGVVENEQHWRLLHSGAVEMGSDWNEPINEKFIDDLQAVDVKGGETNAYNLTMTRLQQFKELRVAYHPFTGPIYNSNGELVLEKGEVISQDDLRWHMDWYVQGTIPP